jgi:hypothetical protein
MRLRDVLDQPELRLALLVGADHLDRPVRRVFTTDLLDPRRYLSGGELVLTGLMWRRGPEDSESFVAALAAGEITALGAGDATYGSIPPDLVAACRRHGVPLFEVPVEVSFRAITERVLGRHRGLVTAVAEGAGLADVLPLVAADLGVWVLSPTGRTVAGTGELSESTAAELARAYLVADRLPRVVPVGDRRFSLFAAPPQIGHPRDGDPASYRLAGWFLACDTTDRAEPRNTGFAPPDDLLNELVIELLTLVALERARRDEGLRVERRLAAELLGLLTGAPGPAPEPGELSARLRSCRLSPDGTFLALRATLTGAPPHAGLACVEEIVRPFARHAAIAAVGAVPGSGSGTHGGVLAVIPITGAATGTDPSVETGAVVEAIRHGVRTLRPGLGSARLAVGVSDPVLGGAALPGAVEQARHAHEQAIARPDQAIVVSCAELASHLLLLAGVPGPARLAFRDRLLGPLLDYDRAHEADMVRTLDTFLSCSGSWNRTAALLHVHVNTLRYRIQRIEQITGRDLGHFADRVDFFLALRLH